MAAHCTKGWLCMAAHCTEGRLCRAAQSQACALPGLGSRDSRGVRQAEALDAMRCPAVLGARGQQRHLRKPKAHSGHHSTHWGVQRQAEQSSSQWGTQRPAAEGARPGTTQPSAVHPCVPQAHGACPPDPNLEPSALPLVSHSCPAPLTRILKSLSAVATRRPSAETSCGQGRASKGTGQRALKRRGPWGSTWAAGGSRGRAGAAGAGGKCCAADHGGDDAARQALEVMSCAADHGGDDAAAVPQDALHLLAISPPLHALVPAAPPILPCGLCAGILLPARSTLGAGGALRCVGKSQAVDVPALVRRQKPRDAQEAQGVHALGQASAWPRGRKGAHRESLRSDSS